ncbi:MAG: hypothetical protein A2138_08535 [Deltaproteobacteria bacterium RBG_16_71_12]|nr:MAG: hypothetical protein A2138_08535 [Deltaproteobacteria bacterium RBG_16_71_12]
MAAPMRAASLAAFLALATTLAAPAASATLGPLPHLQLTPPALLLAADDEEKPAEGDEPKEESTALPDKEVKVGGAVIGESMGGATGFVFKQGFYTQSDLGGFFRLGGFTPSAECDPGVNCKAVLTSQAQPYIGLSIGYDLMQWLGIQLSFGTGFVANAAPYGDAPNSPRDYGVTTLDVGLIASYYFLDRLAVALKLMGGGTFLTPEPDLGEPWYGGNALVGLGVRYATLLPDTFVGLDVNFHGAFAPASSGLLFIPAFSIAPVIKYVF